VRRISVRAVRRENNDLVSVFIVSSGGSFGEGEEEEEFVEVDVVDELLVVVVVVDELVAVEDGDEEEEERANGEIRNTVSEREGVVTISRRFVSASLSWKDVFRSMHWWIKVR
jgi:exosome complex RNA-binding protein Rrp42 (RNase PH superfamily)